MEVLYPTWTGLEGLGVPGRGLRETMPPAYQRGAFWAPQRFWFTGL